MKHIFTLIPILQARSLSGLHGAHGLTKTQIKVIAKPKGAITWKVREEPYSRFTEVVAVSGDKGQCLVCLLFRILEFHPQKCTNRVWCCMPVSLG